MEKANLSCSEYDGATVVETNTISLLQLVLMGGGEDADVIATATDEEIAELISDVQTVRLLY